MKTDELREKYLAFFESKGHTRCPSDVLVPTWDPSVLFTPAGMNQFKDHFLGKVKLEFSRATTCQKCMRTSDIDKVGRTAYHHTFFEMLGNFSFGDYFKRDAIRWAWEFLTDKKWLGIDPGRLSVTVYEDDAEAAEIWAKDIGLASDRIQRMDEDDNFWPASAPSQGPDGVCGPCSEIFYHPDQGAEVEIWNLVFTQFNRVGDPPGNLKPLPSKNIDTGMGLERTVAMLQGVDTNFHIDSLLPIVKAAAEVCGKKYEPDSDDGRRLRRITDHVRACTFAVHENVYPGPNKEKYVIKRLLRRAVLDGHQMGIRGPFLHRIVPKVAEVMKGPYPELSETITRVRGVIEKEEANFFATIDAGLERIYRVFDEMRRDRRMRVDGGVAAELYQTYGVPPELMESLAAERQLTFDWDGYARAMQEHGDASGKMQHAVMGGRKGPLDSLKGALHATAFVGYDTTETTATILGLIVGDAPHDRLVDDVSPGPETVRVVLDRTPFYAESGGQVGDQGLISSDAFTFHVQDTQRDGDLIVHIGRVDRGTLRAGCSATATVAADRREGIRRAHSATHMLHYALQKNLGSHAQQQGSKVDRDWLRFDFSNLTPVDPQQLDRIEQDVYQCVVNKAPISWKTLPLAEARAAGAMMLFGEKYPDPVRMVSMGNFSKELCGGTHLTCTDQVGPFEIIAEEGISAGTRRVVALTGERAREHRQQTIDAVTKAAEIMQVAPAELENAVPALTQQIRSLKKQLAGGEASPTTTTRGKATKRTELDYAQQRVLLKVIARQLNAPMLEVPQRLEAMRKERGTLEQELAQRQRAGRVSADELIAAARDIGGAKVIVAELPMVGSNLMRQLIDQIRKSVSPSAVLFASREGERKVTLVAGVSRELVDRKISAGNWVKEVAPVVGGGGGGKADMAQAGGKLPHKTPAALEKATEWIAAALA